MLAVACAGAVTAAACSLCQPGSYQPLAGQHLALPYLFLRLSRKLGLAAASAQQLALFYLTLAGRVQGLQLSAIAPFARLGHTRLDQVVRCSN